MRISGVMSPAQRSIQASLLDARDLHSCLVDSHHDIAAQVDAEAKPAAAEREAGQAGAGQLEALWQSALEGDLFHSPSHERKYLGFQLFNILLPYLR